MKVSNFFVTLLAAQLLISCGGGGGGSDPSIQPTPATPVAPPQPQLYPVILILKHRAQ
ncbi:hypothetical protein OAE17_04535 [Gammaproteobacteria bacterium]|nr:hypothetical protein [Gammaproteobacteria bacterium]